MADRPSERSPRPASKEQRHGEERTQKREHRSHHGEGTPERREKHRHERDSRHRTDHAHKPTHSRSRSRSPRTYKRRRAEKTDERESRTEHRRRAPKTLPHGARHIAHSNGVGPFEPLFAHYLNEEKGLKLADLDEDEARHRWKRFVARWNAGELAESWYVEQDEDNSGSHDGSSDRDSDDYGPALPAAEAPLLPPTSNVPGPAIPTLADLDERRAMDEDDRAAGRATLRLARRADRAVQRERLERTEEMLGGAGSARDAPAGSRERRLEKKRALNEQMRSFRERSPGGGDGGGLEINDAELGVGGSEGINEYRKIVVVQKQRQTERQSRREEEQRARIAEIEARRREYRAREEVKLEALRALARERYGGRG